MLDAEPHHEYGELSRELLPCRNMGQMKNACGSRIYFRLTENSISQVFGGNYPRHVLVKAIPSIRQLRIECKSFGIWAEILEDLQEAGESLFGNIKRPILPLGIIEALRPTTYPTGSLGCPRRQTMGGCHPFSGRLIYYLVFYYIFDL